MTEAPASVEISKAQIRRRAGEFASRWAGATSEAAEKQTFWNDFFAIFGIERRQVAAFEQIAERASTGGKGFIDVLFPGQMAVEHKSAQKDLDAAMEQAVDYLPALSKAEHPWLVVVCDFDCFKWRNLDSGESGEFSLAELTANLNLFWWMAGHGRPGETFANAEDVNLKATALMAALHDELRAAGYDEHALREWMTRVLFCLFADDTDVWDRAAFHAYIARNTRVDGHDLGSVLAHIFQVLNEPEDKRQTNLDEDLAQFTYINGDLFDRVLPIPATTAATRDALLQACTFDWAKISPAIFGSMFQNVMQAAERRQLGAHYTTEENILRTIRPLFLDALEAELASCKTRAKLNAFHEKLASLTFFDPACGCGNFLVIAYREIRRLETETLRRLSEMEKHATVGKGKRRFEGGQRAMSLDLLCKVRIDQFFGLEIEEFPVRIARTAMYLIDHIANREVSAEFGEHYIRFPIRSTPRIVQADALEMDWKELLSASECDFCFGNPPFAGHITRSLYQSDQMRRIWGAGYAKWLDYVTCWYRKALDYGRGATTRFAFVSTNSVAQGEQVARLWDPMLRAGYRIAFAHQTFAWTSEASGKAHVHVVIIGFSHEPPDVPRQLFTYATLKGEPAETTVKNISPYLVEGPNLTVKGRRSALSASMPAVRYGSLASDGGGLIVDAADVPHADPVAVRYMRRYVGSKELVRGGERWCIWMPDGPAPGDVEKSAFLKARLSAVRSWRQASKNPDTRDLADQPYRFFHRAQPKTAYIGIPAQVSETRRWYTVVHLSADVIASNTVYTADDPDGFVFGVLSSAMFMTWLKAVGGRIKSDVRFSGSVVHNTFPLPQKISKSARQKVVDAGKEVLGARPVGTPLATAYTPLATPPELLKAHAALDAAVDSMFAPRRKFKSNVDRLVLLFERYEAMLPEDDDELLIDDDADEAPAA